ncbi:MAG: hypothetical protein ACI4QM_04000 [Alphaproteobacteria bacterium]
MLQDGKERQIGRSMVEMLGVLALVGLLSVGAVMGFRYAIDDYRVKATINDINLRAVTLDMQMTQNIPLSLREFPAAGTIGYPMGSSDETIEDGFAVTVDNVPQHICRMLLKEMQDQVNLIRISGRVVTHESACAQSNNMSFEFSASSSRISETSPCSDGQVWSMDLCAECVTDDDCSGNTPYCDLGICSACNKKICSGINQFCGSANNSNSVANYNTCKTFKYEKVDDEIGLYRVWVNDSVHAGWWDAYKVCQEIGKSLLSVTDLFTDWDGTSSWAHSPIKPFTPSEMNAKVVKVGGFSQGLWTVNPGAARWSFLWWPNVWIDDIVRTRQSTILCR